VGVFEGHDHPDDEVGDDAGDEAGDGGDGDYEDAHNGDINIEVFGEAGADAGELLVAGEAEESLGGVAGVCGVPDRSRLAAGGAEAGIGSDFAAALCAVHEMISWLRRRR